MKESHDLLNSNWVTTAEKSLEELQDKRRKNPIMRILNVVFEFLQSIALGGAFFVVFYLFIIQPHKVSGKSMYPTYEDKEFILTDKISYKFRDPIRGEVIILKSPKNENIDFIKRVIALPGETVKILDGKVYVNGIGLPEPYLAVDTPAGVKLRENEEFIVPENSYVVLGDNRVASSDSREFGEVPKQNIIGHVIFRYFPVSKLGLIKTPDYAF